MCAVIASCLTYMEISGQNDSFDKSPLVAALMFLSPVVIWYLGIYSKKKLLKGKMTFKQGFIEGFKISLVYALVSPIIFLVYYTVVNPEIVGYVRKVYGMTNASDANVILVDIVATMLTGVVMGTILGAVASFFLKSKSTSKKKKR